MKNKVINIIIIFIFLAICTGCSYTTLSTSEQLDFMQGNTGGNIHNGGIMTAKNNWVYYTNRHDNEKLYKMKLDGSEQQSLSLSHYSYQLNLLDNYIYYTDGLPGFVYRVTYDGKQNHKIVNRRVNNLLVTSNNIFYRLSEDHDSGKLFKTDLEGKNEELLASNVSEFAVNANFIFYANADDNFNLYRMDYNGENVQRISNDYVRGINSNETEVFYSNHNEGDKLYRIQVDGTQKQMLSSDACWNINLYNDLLPQSISTRQNL